MKSALDIRKKIIGQVTKSVLKLGRSHWALRGLQHREQDFLWPGLPTQWGTVRGWYLNVAEEGNFLSFTRARTGALQKWTMVTTRPGTGLISSGFRWLHMNELTRHQQRERAQPAHNSAVFDADTVHINHHTKQSASLQVANKGCPEECQC